MVRRGRDGYHQSLGVAVSRLKEYAEVVGVATECWAARGGWGQRIGLALGGRALARREGRTDGARLAGAEEAGRSWRGQGAGGQRRLRE